MKPRSPASMEPVTESCVMLRFGMFLESWPEILLTSSALTVVAIVAAKAIIYVRGEIFIMKTKMQSKIKKIRHNTILWVEIDF